VVTAVVLALAVTTGVGAAMIRAAVRLTAMLRTAAVMAAMRARRVALGAGGRRRSGAGRLGMLGLDGVGALLRRALGGGAVAGVHRLGLGGGALGRLGGAGGFRLGGVSLLRHVLLGRPVHLRLVQGGLALSGGHGGRLLLFGPMLRRLLLLLGGLLLGRADLGEASRTGPRPARRSDLGTAVRPEAAGLGRRARRRAARA
jgi:hypothetical protein